MKKVQVIEIVWILKNFRDELLTNQMIWNMISVFKIS